MTLHGIVTMIMNLIKAELLPLTTLQISAITEKTQDGSKNN